MIRPDFIDYEDVETLTYLYARGILTEENLKDIEIRVMKPPVYSGLVGAYSEGSVCTPDVVRAYFRAAYEVGALAQCIVQAREFALVGLPHPLLATDEDFKVFEKAFDGADMIIEDILYTLERVINDYLPSGLIFGTHPDDGACIGIWNFGGVEV